MEQTRRGLGRGLSALLGDADAPAQQPRDALAGHGPPREAPIEFLRRNPDQPRRAFAEAEINELAASIRDVGVLQPILVRPAPGAPGEWQIVAGERRWRAAQKAGLHSVPILVRDLDDSQVLEIAIVENVQRADLNPLEEAQGYRTLIERFGRTQESVAQTVGKSRSHVANALRLLQLPERARELLASGLISAGHARAVAAAPDPDELAQAIVRGGLNVRQAEALARRAQGGPDRAPQLKSRDVAPQPPAPPPAPLPKPKDPDTQALEQDLADTLGLDVEIDDENGAGEMRIRYSTLEQLDDLCRRLSGGDL